MPPCDNSPCLVAVNVKWGKEKFPDVEVDTDESPELFKAQLFALSGVAPDRQKVMVKGAVIKVRAQPITAAPSALPIRSTTTQLLCLSLSG